MGKIMIAYVRVCAIGLIILVSTVSPGSAISIDLAKKCRAMAFKVYPPKVIGSKSGNARVTDSYYRNCLANNGNMPGAPAQEKTIETKPQQSGIPNTK